MTQLEQTPAEPAAPKRRTPLIIAGCVVLVLLAAAGITSAFVLKDKGSPTAAPTPAATTATTSAAPSPTPTKYAAPPMPGSPRATWR